MFWIFFCGSKLWFFYQAEVEQFFLFHVSKMLANFNPTVTCFRIKTFIQNGTYYFCFDFLAEEINNES